MDKHEILKNWNDCVPRLSKTLNYIPYGSWPNSLIDLSKKFKDKYKFIEFIEDMVEFVELVEQVPKEKFSVEVKYNDNIRNSYDFSTFVIRLHVRTLIETVVNYEVRCTLQFGMGWKDSRMSSDHLLYSFLELEKEKCVVNMGENFAEDVRKVLIWLCRERKNNLVNGLAVIIEQEIINSIDFAYERVTDNFTDMEAIQLIRMIAKSKSMSKEEMIKTIHEGMAMSLHEN